VVSLLRTLDRCLRAFSGYDPVGGLGSPRINVLPADVFANAPVNAAFIALRPEQISHGDGEESFVERVEHLGDQTRLRLKFKSHDLITVTDAIPNWPMAMSSGSGPATHSISTPPASGSPEGKIR
jgi:hypothetical protein